MEKKELPKAQLGAIIKMAKGAYQGMKTGYKTYKAASLAEKAAKLKKAQAAARAQKAAATRAANAAKNPKPATPKPGTTKPGTTKTETPKPGTPKGKEPFVKSKARLATENITGKVIGGFPFYTINTVGKVLKNPWAQGILGTTATLAAANRYAKTNAPKKVKKYKKK